MRYMDSRHGLLHMGRSHLRLEVRRRHGPPADERVDQRHHPARDQESNIPHESGLLGQLAYVATPAVYRPIEPPAGAEHYRQRTRHAREHSGRALSFDEPRLFGPVRQWFLGFHPPVFPQRGDEELKDLILSRNRLTGSIPGGTLGGLSVLNAFDVGDNGLTGSIPTEIGNLRALRYLTIQNNRLEGALPSSLTACTGLVALAAGTNRLGGPFPVNTLLRLPKLESLSLKRNGFIVTSLAPLANHPNLRDIDLSQNKVARRILATLAQMKSIQSLSLAGNRLTGSVPAFLLANQPKLYKLDLSFNRLSGSFPWTAVQGAPELVGLDIQNNMLSGRIPDNSFKGLRMSSLNISNNFFAGILPKFNSPIWEF
ncbi:unnamed protein product [Closterium sp. NIES-54]